MTIFFIFEFFSSFEVFAALFLSLESTSQHLAKFILLSYELTDIESSGWLAFASRQPSSRPANKLSVVHIFLESCSLNISFIKCRLIINSEKARYVNPLRVTNKIIFVISCFALRFFGVCHYVLKYTLRLLIAALYKFILKAAVNV